MGFFSWLAKRKMAKARRLSQPFAVSVADSLTGKPQDWDFSTDEKCLINQKADLVSTVPQFSASDMQIIRYSHNGGIGSLQLAQYWRGSWDRWLVESAFEAWKEATALERERDRETWKAKATVALAA